MKTFSLVAVLVGLAAGVGGWLGYQSRSMPVAMRVDRILAPGTDFPKEAFRRIDDELPGKLAELAGKSAATDHLVAVVPASSGYEVKISAPAASPIWEKQRDLTKWLDKRMTDFDRKLQAKAARDAADLAAASTPPAAPAPPQPPAPSAAELAAIRENEKAAAEASARLQEAQAELEKTREEAFQARPDLSYAYEANKTYGNWQQMNGQTPEARTWWNGQKDPEVRTAMRTVTRKLAVQEFAARLDDPSSAEWMRTWSDDEQANSEQGLDARQEWWEGEFEDLPDFGTLPPAEVVAALMNPQTRGEFLNRYKITPQERSLIKPAVLFHLEGSASAAAISNSGAAFYLKNRGNLIAMQEALVQRSYQEMVSMMNVNGTPIPLTPPSNPE